MARGRPRKDQTSSSLMASTKAPSFSLGYQQITDLTCAVSLVVPDNAEKILIQAEGAAVRWRDDGEEPLSSVGMRIPAGAELRYDGDPKALKFIQEGSGAKLNITYYG